MKEELKNLKEDTKKLGQVAEAMDKARTEFNMFAQVAGVLDGYFDERCVDYYDAADNFVMLNRDIIEEYENSLVSCPDYGDKRRKIAVVDTVLKAREVDYEENFDSICDAYDEYVIIRECGYSNVKTLEGEADVISAKIGETAKVVTKEGKDAVVEAAKKVASCVATVVRPYGIVAKGQMRDAGVKVKSITNRGVKKLINKLEEIDKKTQ